MPVAKSKGLDFPGLYFASTDTIVQSIGLRPSDVMKLRIAIAKSYSFNLRRRIIR